MKTPKGPKIIKANFPAPPQAAQPPKIEKVPDFVLNFTTMQKIITVTVPNDQMPKFALMLCALLSNAGITYSKEEKSR